jgi:hypothetical protein
MKTLEQAQIIYNHLVDTYQKWDGYNLIEAP